MTRIQKITVCLIALLVLLTGLTAPAIASDQVDTDECTYSVSVDSIDTTSTDTSQPSPDCGGGGGVCSMLPNCDATDT